MHSSVSRLLDYARRKVRPSISLSEIGRQLGVSAATMTNWKARGISKEGAIKAESLFGCSVTWLLVGDGREDSSAAPQVRAVAADPIRQGIGLRLAVARQQKELTQQHVAERLGTDSGKVIAWESGREMPDALALRELAKLYNTSSDALLWEDSLTAEAMQFAAEFDSLNEDQKRTLHAMWMAYIRESATDQQLEDKRAVTKDMPRFQFKKFNTTPPLLPANRETEEEQKKED